MIIVPIILNNLKALNKCTSYKLLSIWENVPVCISEHHDKEQNMVKAPDTDEEAIPRINCQAEVLEVLRVTAVLKFLSFKATEQTQSADGDRAICLKAPTQTSMKTLS